MHKTRYRFWVAGGALIAVLAALYVAQHPMDFRVYYFGARGVFDGTRPVYGRTSGLGWPMHYRYPPLFLLLFAPLALLPLAWGVMGASENFGARDASPSDLEGSTCNCELQPELICGPSFVYYSLL